MADLGHGVTVSDIADEDWGVVVTNGTVSLKRFRPEPAHFPDESDSINAGAWPCQNSVP